MAEEHALTSNDSVVLSRLFDPESSPNSGVTIDLSLPADPHVKDPEVLNELKQQEAAIIKCTESLLQDPSTASQKEDIFLDARAKLTSLIDSIPNYASARVNRAQLLRLQHGSTLLVKSLEDAGVSGTSPSAAAAALALSDLTTAIRLLSPASPQSPISSAQCRTLAQAHTQRAALYYVTSKSLSTLKDSTSEEPNQKILASDLKHWNKQDFEAAASRDFLMGGRYGNEIGKALAVYTNPTAKLCGQMVHEAMRRECSAASRAEK
ncbi:hypothetical protein MMC20_004031 [Loxospora ochrophaea]|nr:hypothetical protein [Loxospora ochrophaea]